MEARQDFSREDSGDGLTRNWNMVRMRVQPSPSKRNFHFPVGSRING